MIQAKKEVSDDIAAAFAAYNELAARHNWQVCRALTESRKRRLAKRLADIGGLEAFKTALAAIPLNAFLMGQTAPRVGMPVFRLDIERLLSTDSKMADVLAKLLDTASDGTGGAGNGQKARDLAGIDPKHLAFEAAYDAEQNAARSEAA